MRMLRLSTYSQALIYRPNMGLNGFPSPNSLDLTPSSKNPNTTSIRLTKNPTERHQLRSLAQPTGASSDNASVIAANVEGNNCQFFSSGLLRERMPKHVAAIFDGNRRWSRANNSGHLTYEHFYSRYILLAELCVSWEIPAASSFVFPTCTWKRADEDKSLMFAQFQTTLQDNLEKFIRQGIRVSIVGEKGTLPKPLQETIKQVEEATKDGITLDFRYAIPYGGRDDIVAAARSISKKVKDGEIKPEDINEALVEHELSTGIDSFPDPDLIIRYGGKHRLSNFYVWQSSHAELYFSDILGPEFEEYGFIDALRWFQQCGRRFGK